MQNGTLLRQVINKITGSLDFNRMEEDGIETNFPQKFRTRETADLFLVLITTVLKDGGRGAIVLPDGTLLGEGVKTAIKEKVAATLSDASFFANPVESP